MLSTFRRYWAAGLIIVVVIAHATIIGYVRSRVSRLTRARSTALEVGTFRFQHIKEPETVYQFRLHAIPDPGRRIEAEERIKQLRVEILESAEQLLRQADSEWLNDPTQTEIRDRLMEVVGKHLSEPLVQRVIITDWLEIPTSTYTTTLTAGPAAPVDEGSSGQDALN